MKTLADLRPYVGDSMPYLYDGSANEGLRNCNVFAFHLFIDGPGAMEIEGKRFPIERKTLVFLRPGQSHAFHMSSHHPLASYNLYCDLWASGSPVSLNRTFFRWPEPYLPETWATQNPCDELDAMPGIFSLQPHPHLFDGFLQIANTFDKLQYYRNEAVNSLLYAWILNWHNAIHTHQPSDYRIVRLLAHLDLHPEMREPVETWWKLCGLKRTYFHELFLRETGMTPKAYQNKLLMKRAANLLQESELSVTAVAERLGYPSIHPFTRHFSAYYGTSPRQFRMTGQPSTETAKKQRE